ncbi:MAG: hypothetical protein ACTSX8_03575 [Alphaproteobacteria bacterium]
MSSPEVIRVASLLARLEHHGIVCLGPIDVFDVPGIGTYAGMLAGHALIRLEQDWFEAAKLADSVCRLGE